MKTNKIDVAPGLSIMDYGHSASDGSQSFYTKVNLKWGYVHVYAQRRKNKNWNYQVYWTNTETGSDNTLALKRNQKHSDIKAVVYECLCICRNYFENHETRTKIESNIEKLDQVMSSI